jgi:hypothetical protein
LEVIGSAVLADFGTGSFCHGQLRSAAKENVQAFGGSSAKTFYDRAVLATTIGSALRVAGEIPLTCSAAVTIGARVGRPEPRVTAMRQEVLAMFRSETLSGKDPWDCNNVQAVTQFAHVQAQLGGVRQPEQRFASRANRFLISQRSTLIR